ncbi:MAG: EI24 domain-containing protein [Deltaproteobacteria bacterium]|nr:EI24 domain-containing protein [Deltaproteobacteria bacterium]
MRHKKLKRVALIPFMINMIIFILLIIGLIYYLPTGIQFLQNHFLRETLPESSFFYYFFWIFFFILGFFLSFFITLFLGIIISSPFNDLLSSKTEELIKEGENSDLLSLDGRGLEERVKRGFGDMWLSVSNEIKKFILLIVLQLILIVLNFLPVLGTTLYSILSLFIAFLFLAFEFTDYSFARKRFLFKEKKSVVFRNFCLFLGFGASLFIVLLVPFVNFFLIPVGVVGGTLLYCDNLDKNENRITTPY